MRAALLKSRLVKNSMSTRQELLSAFAKRLLWRIAQLPDEQLSSLLEMAVSLKSQRDFAGTAPDRRAFLGLPTIERETLLAQQVAVVSQYFQPGTEEVEWAEEYVEDDWNDE